MPAIVDSSAIVLVTGANGFLGTWIVQQLLEKGYCVRAAVRNTAKGTYLQARFKSYKQRLEIVIVEDMTKSNAFAHVVRGVDGIIHTASPVTTIADSPEELTEPAVRGVTRILESARDYGERVGRIVITSSCAAILDTSDEEVTVSEDDWNDQRVRECEIHGRNAVGLAKYSASKVLAERAAWDFVRGSHERISWDLTTICPPYIFGPPIHDVESPDLLKSSSKLIYNALVNNNFAGVPPLERPGHGWVDVRDVAAAHIKALETPEAGGERILLSAGSFVWEDFINSALSLPEGIYRAHAAATGPKPVKRRLITFKTEKAERILGLKLLPLEDCVRDTLVDYAERGWY